jgi:hypothetical protein
VPWLIYIFINREDIQQSLSWQKIGVESSHHLINLLQSHLNGVVKVFINASKIGLNGTLKSIAKWTYGLLILSGIILFFWKARSRQKLFVGLMAFLGVVLIITMDMLRSSGTSGMPRYLLLNFIGFIVLFSFSLQKAMERKTLIFGVLFLMIITGGILSSFALAKDTADNKRADAYIHQRDAAERFSGNEKILIISDFQLIGPHSYSKFLSVLHASSNENIDFIYAKPNYPDFKKEYDPGAYDAVYGMYMSDGLKAHLERNFTPEEFVLVEDRTIYRRFNIPLYAVQVTNNKQQITNSK